MTSVDYTHIFEDSLNEIYVFSAQTLYFLEVNRGARENLGYTMEELRKLTPLELKPEHTPQSFAGLIAPLRDGNREKVVFDTNHRRKDGTFYPVEVHLHLSEIDEEPVFVAIILDITERVAAEKHALQLALEREQVRLLREFIGDVSHDLQTPLTQAGTSLYLLGHHTSDTKHHKYIERIDGALNRVQHMINSMFQMSELDLGDNYKMAPVDIGALLKSLWDENESIARERGISLRLVPGAADVLTTLGDDHYLTRTFENILYNALMYTEAGGTVTLRTSTIPSTIFITIQDTGCGIPPKDLPHIFNRFYRGDSTRNTSGGSNGLGLAIAKKIIDKHEGTIAVETKLGEGSTFTVTLRRMTISPGELTVLSSRMK